MANTTTTDARRGRQADAPTQSMRLDGSAALGDGAGGRPGQFQALRRAAWFVALWCGGVAGALVLAEPFRLLVHSAMH